MGRRPATAVATNVAATVRSRDGIMARANYNGGQVSEFPESTGVRNGSVGSRMGRKTKGFFEESIGKLKELLGKKN